MIQPEAVASFLHSLGIFALPASLAISILIAVAGVIPSIFVTAANVLIFGPGYGFLISWLGEMLGALISFYLYRVGFRKPFHSLLVARYPSLVKITEYQGIPAGLLLFQARLLPFLPSGIVTFAGAVSKVNMGIFLIATALGKIPSLALETFISYDLVHVGQNWLRLLLTILSLAGLFIIFRKKKI